MIAQIEHLERELAKLKKTRNELTERYKEALHWCKSEIHTSVENDLYEKKTLASNLLDRINAALAEGPYKPRNE